MLNRLAYRTTARSSFSASLGYVVGRGPCRSASYSPRRSVGKVMSSSGPRPSEVYDDYWLACLPDSQHPDISLSQQPEGKWMLFYKQGPTLDDAWGRATRLFHAGELKGVYGMKVSTGRPNPNARDPSVGVIILYCGFEDDEAETKAVGRTILQKMKYTGSGPGEPSRSRTGRIWWKSNNQTLANQYSKDGNRASTFWVEYKTVNRRVAAAAEAQLAGQPVRCDCGLEVLRLTSRSEKNPNRDFMCCPKPRDDASRCDCFVWADEVAAHLTQQSA